MLYCSSGDSGSPRAMAYQEATELQHGKQPQSSTFGGTWSLLHWKNQGSGLRGTKAEMAWIGVDLQLMIDEFQSTVATGIFWDCHCLTIASPGDGNSGLSCYHNLRTIYNNMRPTIT